MHLLFLFSLISTALALPQGYGAPAISHGGGGGGGGGGYGGGQKCGPNEVLHVDGRCVTPIVNRNVFLYAAPEVAPVYAPPPHIPDPKIDYNIVFVRTPEGPQGQDPIIVPPPQQKTLVYVLNKAGQIQGQQVIEVPSNPQKPEVFYVNYNDGENLQLPGGIDIQSALASANAQQGQLIDSGAGGFGGGFGGGSGGFGGGGGSGYGGSSGGGGGGGGGGGHY